jgi:prolycopene isomerase
MDAAARSLLPCSRPPGVARVASRYDAVVVGAGVGGLVAAVYLAQGGLRVLLVEQHGAVGGCCTSFRRKGFTFDACVHTLSALAPAGVLRRVLEETGVWGRIRFVRSRCPDRLVTPSFTLGITDSAAATLREFQRVFPHEAAPLERFFTLLTTADVPGVFARYGRGSFQRVLDDHFRDPTLQATVEMLLDYGAIPAGQVLAAAAVALLQGLVLDAGYYPLGGEGMQGFANALAARFRELGGDLLLAHAIERIDVRAGAVRGVRIAGAEVAARYVVSNGDARSTLLELIDPAHLPASFRSRVAVMHPSISAFCVYVGLDVPLRTLAPVDGNLLYFDPGATSADRLRHVGRAAQSFLYAATTSLHDPATAPAGQASVALVTAAPYGVRSYWAARRADWTARVLAAAERVLPGIERHAVVVESATPDTIQRYTRNHRGAMYGWACEPEQDGLNRLGNRTPIENLYLAGHWTRPGAGVPLVARSGRLVAATILRRERVGGRHAVGADAASPPPWRPGCTP